MANKKRQDYINNFNKEHYTIIRVVVPKTDTEVLEKLNTVNMVNTLNNRIKDVVEEQNERKRS